MLYQACKSDPLNMVPLWRIHLQVLLYLSLFCSKSLEHIALQNKKSTICVTELNYATMKYVVTIDKYHRVP